MTREVYEALKTRITVTVKAVNTWHWEFENEGLNPEAIDCFDDRWVDAMCQDVHTGNLWNIAQRVYSLLRLLCHDEDIDARLIANQLKK